MVAHLDAVTSLAVDQHGLYLISGSHDCSIRCVGVCVCVWERESLCVFESFYVLVCVFVRICVCLWEFVCVGLYLCV